MGCPDCRSNTPRPDSNRRSSEVPLILDSDAETLEEATALARLDESDFRVRTLARWSGWEPQRP